MADIYAHELHDSLHAEDFESQKKDDGGYDLTDKVRNIVNVYDLKSSKSRIMTGINHASPSSIAK